MKHRVYAALGLSFALVIASARGSFAGVVMAETSTSTGLDGQSESQLKTIYVQGNKQKIERQDVAAITDLDKSLIYVVDKQHHAYAEIPLHKLRPSPPREAPGQAITLDRTKRIRVVANHPCREYQASEGNQLERVTVRACVSTDAPGAREISDFHREMIARLSGQDSQASGDYQAGALMLEKQSVVSFRIPDPSQNKPYRMASLSSRTRINDIQLRPLSPQTFEPPQGFNRLPNRPEVNRPVAPGTAGNSLEIAWRSTTRDLHAANL